MTDSGGTCSTLIVLHAAVLWIWPRALQALFKIFWLDASLRQGDACSRHARLPIAPRPRTATFSHRPARNTYLKLMWLPRFGCVDPQESEERMPARATAYRLFKVLIIKDFQASKYLVTSKTRLSRIDGAGDGIRTHGVQLGNMSVDCK